MLPGNQNISQRDKENQINKLMNHLKKANPPFSSEPNLIKVER